MAVKIGKFMIFLFTIYISWFCEVFGDYKLILYGVAICATLPIIIDCTQSKNAIRDLFPKSIKTFFIFAIYSFVSGVFICINSQSFLTSIFTLFAFSLVCFDCNYICLKEKKADWLWLIFVVSAIFCSLQMVFAGVPWQNGHVYVITMSLSNNPNTLALVLLVGMVAACMLQTKGKISNFVSFGLLLLLMYTIILTGSRKCILSGALLFAVFIITYILYALKKKSSAKKTIGLIFCILCLPVALYALISFFVGSVSFERIQQLFQGDNSNNMRVMMYKEAFQFFKEKPLFGIGYNQFAVQSSFGGYSHSTYAELLACTGFVGFSLFVFPFVSEYIMIIKCYFNKKSDKFNAFILFLVFSIMLFIASAQILFYISTQMMFITGLFYECSALKKVNANDDLN